MHKLLFAICFIGFFYFCHAQVGIGTTSPSPASMLEVSSTSNGISFKGFMPPRVTLRAQRDAINPDVSDAGLLIVLFDTPTNTYCLQIWNGARWEDVYCLTSLVTGSQVQFDSAFSFIQEDGGGLDLTFNITDPSPTNAITITIAANDYSDLDESLPQTLIIPAGATSFVANSIFNITDDAAVEPSENVDFTITSISGGLGAVTIGALNTHILTITNNDGPFVGVAQDFDLLNTWAYSTDVPFFDNGSDGFYNIDNGTQLNNITALSGNFVGLEDLNDEGNGTTGFATLTFATVGVAGGTGIILSFDYDVVGFDTNDDVYYTVTIDGLDQPEVFLINGVGDLTVSGTETINIPDGSSTLGFRIRYRQNGPDQFGLDNILLN